MGGARVVDVDVDVDDCVHVWVDDADDDGDVVVAVAVAQFSLQHSVVPLNPVTASISFIHFSLFAHFIELQPLQLIP